MVRAPSTICRVVTPKTEHRTLYLLDWSFDMDERRFDRIVCELDGYPGWRIQPEVDVTEAGLRLRRLIIEPSGPVPPAGITTRMLRQLRTGDLIAALRAASWQSARYFGESPDLSVNTRVGRRGRDDLYYARWAAAYTDALTRFRATGRRPGRTAQPQPIADSQPYARMPPPQVAYSEPARPIRRSADATCDFSTYGAVVTYFR